MSHDSGSIADDDRPDPGRSQATAPLSPPASSCQTLLSNDLSPICVFGSKSNKEHRTSVVKSKWSASPESPPSPTLFSVLLNKANRTSVVIPQLRGANPTPLIDGEHPVITVKIHDDIPRQRVHCSILRAARGGRSLPPAAPRAEAI